jgi:hypothetical protein
VIFPVGIYHRVLVPPIPVSVNNLKQLITVVFVEDVLWSVWNKPHYHIDICHVAEGLGIEHLFVT